MKINRDGSVDEMTLKGFHDGDYILNNGEVIDGAKLKEQKLTEINIELENVNGDIDEYNNTIENYGTIISGLTQQKADTQATLNEINTLIENGAVLLESKTGGSGIYEGISAFDQKMQHDMGCIRYTNNDPGASNKITQAQYNTMMSDYQNALSENQNLTLTEFLNTSDYGFSDTQKTNIVNGYNDVNSRLSVTPHGFSQYVGKDGVKYIAAINPTGEGVAQSCDNIANLNSQIENINNQIQMTNDIKANGAELIASLEQERTKLLTEYNAIWDTPVSEYSYSSGDYSIVFNDIRGAKDARITINGITNANITGSGTFDMAKAGLQIDNYSTRTLVFNDIYTADTESAINNFIINGRSQADFANKNQAISGQKANEYFYGSSSWWQQNNERPSFDSLPTNGVHYITSDNGATGTIINNYYDNNHPFAASLDIQNPTLKSDIIINGDINSNSLNILNESGNISVNTEEMNTNNIQIFAPNGQVDFNVHYDATNNAKFTLNSDDRIFAANGININADVVDIKNSNRENLKTGYSVRGITITDDMLKESNLIVDNTTGEKNLINLKDNRMNSAFNDYYDEGNIKAIYKDGKIYLYNLPALKEDNGIKINAKQGNVAPNATVSTGSQSIKINNQTNKELVVGDIINTSYTGKYSVSDGVSKNTNAGKHQVIKPQINITSNGKVSVNGKIQNGLDNNGNPIEDSELIIKSKNGMNIAKHQMYNAITASGLIDVANNDSGTLNIYGNINNKKGDTKLYGADGLSLYGKIINQDGDVIMTAPRGDLKLAKGSMVRINQGDIELHQKDENGTLIMEGQLILFNGTQKIDSNGKQEKNNDLIFEFDSEGRNLLLKSENDLTILSQPLLNNDNSHYVDITQSNLVENDYVVSSNMDFGYDVSQDKGLKSDKKILRINRRGATIVNNDNWQIGEQHDITLQFDNVDVTVKCEVIKVENELAQVKFKNLPQDVANKITYRYMKIANNL